MSNINQVVATIILGEAILEHQNKVREAAKKLANKFAKDRKEHPKLSGRERLEAADRYAAADKSDPFARARIATHMKNGVAGFTNQGEDAFYSADEYQETRYLEKTDENGQKYQEAYTVPAYKNRVRP